VNFFLPVTVNFDHRDKCQDEPAC